MMTRLVLVALYLLLDGAVYCYGQHETIYVNTSSSNPTVEGYAKKNTTVQWKVLNSTDSFQIKFKGSAPCQPTTDPNPLNATATHAATCKIRVPRGYKNGDVLRFQYKILHTKIRPADDQEFYEHVGSCDTCVETMTPAGTRAAASKATGTPTPTSLSIPTDYIETLSCTSPHIDPDPSLNVLPGDRVHWQNPNDAAKPSWTITFDDSTACKDPVTSKNPTCEVTGAPSATPYTYHVTVANGQAPNGCKFDGSIVVTP